MSVLATGYLTLVDMLKQKVGDSIVSDIAEIMSENCDIIHDAHVMECNDGSNHKTVVRHGLPKGTFRKLYGFVPTEKSETEQVVDKTGMLEAYSVVDVDLVDKAANPKQFRLNESKAFIEGMTQTSAETLIYGSIADNDATFDGLAVRYDHLSNDKKDIGYNVVDAGGTGSDNTSVWFITWGEQAVSLIYPKGSQGGLQHKDDGIQTETNEKGAKRKVYQDHFKQDLGLSVKDWRSTCRIANISLSDLKAGKISLLDLFIDANSKTLKHRKKSGLKTFIYCNDTLMSYFDKEVTKKDNVYFTVKDYGGEDIVHYRGIPIRCIDQILNTEERVAIKA